MKFGNKSHGYFCFFITGLALASTPAVMAQHETGGAHTPMQYFRLTNVAIKPEQSGAFTKVEAQRVEALRAAGSPSHYIAMSSLTNDSHVLYMNGVASFASLEKTHDDAMTPSKLTETLTAEDEQEAPLITDRHSSIFSYEKDLSLVPSTPPDLSKMRFMRMIVFHIRAGQDQEWVRAMKLLVKAYQSSVPEARWDMYLNVYGGGSDDTWVLVTSMASLSAVDDMRGDNKKISDVMGDDQLQMIRSRLANVVESSESDLFAFDAKSSYVPDAWLTSSPEFWGKK